MSLLHEHIYLAQKNTFLNTHVAPLCPIICFDCGAQYFASLDILFLCYIHSQYLIWFNFDSASFLFMKRIVLALLWINAPWIL
jgi:hypothetical protein